MKMRRGWGIGLALAIVASASSASADDSTKGPLYVQAMALGLNYLNLVGVSGLNQAGFRPEFEVGYHFSGRHDGVVVGFRQGFVLTELPAKAGGVTAFRGGYDIPMKLSGFEITIAPYATFGLGYLFDGPSAGITLTGGVEGKMFLTDQFYVGARPFEIGVQCFHDFGECGLNMAFAAGGGMVFGK